MKSISVSDYLHKRIMDLKDNDHKSADAVITGLIDANRLLNQTVDKLMEDIRTEHLLVGEFDENEQRLIFQMLDGPLQSEDEDVYQPAQSIEKKLKI